jgi:hypothetical protein
LYQAKRSGRNQVCVVTENATFGVSGRNAAGNGSGGRRGAREAADPVTEIIQAS